MQALKFKVENHIGYLYLSRPPKNEMDALFFSELSEFINITLPQTQLQGLVITGEFRHFSSGANVEELVRFTGQKGLSYFAKNISNLESFSLCPFPVVAVVNGICFGSAFELALACHYRIASPTALFSFPEISFNLMPGCGGTYFLPKLIGKSGAIDLILSGRSLFADDAHKLGIVDIIADKKDTLGTAKKLIDKLSSAGKNSYENSVS